MNRIEQHIGGLGNGAMFPTIMLNGVNGEDDVNSLEDEEMNETR